MSPKLNFNVIHESVKIGNNVKIGAFNVIYDNVQIGDNTVIGNYCEIGTSSKIGKNAVLQGKVRMAEKCIIEDNVIIKYGTILTSEVYVKKEAFIGPNVITLGATHTREEIYGTVIGERCFIGGGAQIKVGTHIANDVVIGALSFVNNDIIKPGIYVGVPAKFKKPLKN